MAQLKEDEWPEDREPTTTEREERIKNRPDRSPKTPSDAGNPLTVPVTNTDPDDGVG